ncbi:MAG TPA: hypothetical protein VLV78_08460 [Thermoanaerobaculia bacterium]|nr:hypothetical protein [Thermoanaerobaculia bacterium]
MRLRDSSFALAVVVAGLFSACAKTFAQPARPPSIHRATDPTSSPMKAPPPPSDDGKRYL